MKSELRLLIRRVTLDNFVFILSKYQDDANEFTRIFNEILLAFPEYDDLGMHGLGGISPATFAVWKAGTLSPSTGIRTIFLRILLTEFLPNLLEELC